MTMKNIFTGLLAFVTLLSCEQKKDETLVLHSEAGLSLGFTHFKTFTGIVLPQAFVNRIQKLVFEIDEDFDFLSSDTEVKRFCIKYNLTSKVDLISYVAGEMLLNHLKDVRPLTVRLTHAELSSETAMDFMVEGAQNSPLPEGDNLDDIRAKVIDIVEEPTSRGFRVKILI